MLRSFLRSRIRAHEQRLGVSLEYMRHILRESLRSFFKFIKIMPAAHHRRALPAGPYHIARIVATRDADCGTCVQIAVNLARKDGVSVSHIQAALERRPEDLPEEMADVYRFSEAVVTNSGAENDLRQTIRHYYGEEAFVELAIAIAVCRVFPITKRALGHALSCADVHIQPEGTT